MVIAAAYNVQKAAGRDLTDDEVVQVLRREVKMRRESVEAYTAGGRPDSAEKEKAEIDVIAAYLPEQLGDAEIEAMVRSAIEEAGATSPRDMGRVMSLVMAKARGRVDGKQVSALVARELAARDLAGHGH
jgi:uncharacterized protein YqeY